MRLLPEERVREDLLVKLKSLGFPLHQIVCERALSSLEHIDKRKDLPKRRLDLLCYGRDIHPIHTYYPLLMVECKAVAIDKRAFAQVVGYNYHVESYFIAVVNQHQSYTGWYDEKKNEYQFVEGLFSYRELVDKLCLT